MKRLGGVLLVVVALAAGCGKGAVEAPAADDDSTATSLTISVVAAEGDEPTVMTLECDPAGGDHPNAEAACDKLAAAAPAVFEAVPADQPCTMIYGGPQTATIDGTYGGAPVDATFSRQNGCEIDRWDSLGTEVFDVPLQ